MDGTAINMQPIHDPAASVVMQASLANVDSVMVAGRWRKRSGSLLVEGLAGRVLNKSRRFPELGSRGDESPALFISFHAAP